MRQSQKINSKVAVSINWALLDWRFTTTLTTVQLPAGFLHLL